MMDIHGSRWDWDMFIERTVEDESIVEEAFSRLARAQRGLPERMAVSLKSNPRLFHATGVFTLLAEHVGDLTHRLTEHGGAFTGYGYQTVGEKVARALRYARSADSGEERLSANIARNVANNHMCRTEDGKTTQTLEEFHLAFVEAALAYSDAHASLEVYNPAQWHARGAAVALGRMDFAQLLQHLEVLEEQLALGQESWIGWAGSAHIQDGRVAVFIQPAPVPEPSRTPY
jgi:hypothetical protein